MSYQPLRSPLRWIVAHGTLGAPERNWFPWLTWQGIKAGTKVRVPRLPTPTNQSYENWLRAFDEQVGALDDRCVVIGHSTGVPFLLRTLQERQIRVAAGFFVSGFVDELPRNDILEPMRPLIASFVDFGFDGAAVSKLITTTRCFHGDNDDIVPLEWGQRVATAMACPMEIVAGGRHLNTEAGLFEFPALLRAIEQVR
jgi:predicted alpha/beta hydrolase family esterase